ncbi:MAG TPA: tellurite resistance/C4-dicarboxylate transporter family protein [Ktedonobacterales bacterium]|nr:tellurite resistance/C4-dicarboxylate transporter family protein [Ktedonobacterales bacterium]
MATAKRQTLGSVWLVWVRTLYTGYLASVMATGIVSIALYLNHVTVLSVILWVVACILLAFLTAVYVLRWVMFPREVRSNLTDPTTVFGYFTFVAAVGVVATRFSLGGWTLVPGILTLIAAASWLVLTYWAFAMLIFVSGRMIDQSVNGSWLISIVATESLAITWVLLIQVRPELTAVLQLVAYMFWTFGVLLYLIFIAFIMYRFFFTHIRPTDLSPPYWINMGAMAITTVAGARLFQLPHPDAFLTPLKSYILGFTVMMWAWGTWWIPLLIIIGIWKYGISKQLLTYAPPLWSIVFPLGMYATAVQLLAKIPGLEFVGVIGPAATWIAFGAWALTAAGWAWSAISTVRSLGAAQAIVNRPSTRQEAQGQISRSGSVANADSAAARVDDAEQHGTDTGTTGYVTEAGSRGDTRGPAS